MLNLRALRLSRGLSGFLRVCACFLIVAPPVPAWSDTATDDFVTAFNAANIGFRQNTWATLDPVGGTPYLPHNWRSGGGLTAPGAAVDNVTPKVKVTQEECEQTISELEKTTHECIEKDGNWVKRPIAVTPPPTNQLCKGGAIGDSSREWKTCDPMLNGVSEGRQWCNADGTGWNVCSATLCKKDFALNKTKYTCEKCDLTKETCAGGKESPVPINSGQTPTPAPAPAPTPTPPTTSVSSGSCQYKDPETQSFIKVENGQSVDCFATGAVEAKTTCANGKMGNCVATKCMDSAYELKDGKCVSKSSGTFEDQCPNGCMRDRITGGCPAVGKPSRFYRGIEKTNVPLWIGICQEGGGWTDTSRNFAESDFPSRSSGGAKSCENGTEYPCPDGFQGSVACKNGGLDYSNCVKTSNQPAPTGSASAVFGTVISIEKSTYEATEKNDRRFTLINVKHSNGTVPALVGKARCSKTGKTGADNFNSTGYPTADQDMQGACWCQLTYGNKISPWVFVAQSGYNISCIKGTAEIPHCAKECARQASGLAQSTKALFKGLEGATVSTGGGSGGTVGGFRAGTAQK